jgi:hypothetical protein
MILAMRLPIIQTGKHAERLRSVGSSSGDETGSDSMKYWEAIADKLHAACARLAVLPGRLLLVPLRIAAHLSSRSVI